MKKEWEFFKNRKRDWRMFWLSIVGMLLAGVAADSYFVHVVPSPIVPSPFKVIWGIVLFLFWFSFLCNFFIEITGRPGEE